MKIEEEDEERKKKKSLWRPRYSIKVIKLIQAELESFTTLMKMFVEN